MKKEKQKENENEKEKEKERQSRLHPSDLVDFANCPAIFSRIWLSWKFRGYNQALSPFCLPARFATLISLSLCQSKDSRVPSGVVIGALVLLAIFFSGSVSRAEGAGAGNDAGSLPVPAPSQSLQPPAPSSQNPAPAGALPRTEQPRPALYDRLKALSLTGWKPSDISICSFARGAEGRAPTLADLPALPVAPQFLSQFLSEFGCRSVTWRHFQRGQRRVIVEIFEFAAGDGAFGAYALLRKGATTVIVRGDASSEDDVSISFWKSRFFVRIYGTSEDDDEMKGAEKMLADALVSDIQGRASLPMIVLTLPKIDRVRGTEKLIGGPCTLRHYFFAPYLDALPLSDMHSAAVCDYKFSEPYRERMKFLQVDYKSEKAARNAYDHYVEQLKSEHKRLTDDSRSDLVSLFKVSGLFVLCKQSGDKLMIVTGAKKKDSAIMLAGSADY